MTIPRAFINELIARTDIVEVIDAYVPLRKSGKEYTACCPFHDEKTPSFSVSPEKQFYHCFGCGAGGNVISFIMDHARLDFVEAIQDLASRAGLTVPYEQGTEITPAERRDDLYELSKQAARYYQEQLRPPSRARDAVNYLKKRGLSEETITEFGLGYAPPGWDNLSKALARKPETGVRLLTAGLLVEKEQGGYYDRFRNRLIFPIHDQRGRVVAFGGRVLDDSKPKYLNSPETPIFHKGRELYGLYFVRKIRPLPERVVVVEGYMDVAALAQYGIRNAAATLGTAVSSEHLNRLFRTVPEIVFCFDGDEAGRKAAWRALETVLPLLRDGRQASFMFLPEGDDPDSLVRKNGAEDFQRHLRQAAPLSDFLFEHLSKQTNMATLDGRARLAELAKPLLAALPDGPYRDLMIDRLGELTHLAQKSLAAFPLNTAVQPPPFAARQDRRKKRSSHMRTAIGLLVQNPGFSVTPEELEVLKKLNLAGVKLLLALLEFIREHPHLNTGAVLEHWRDTEHERPLKKLAAWDHRLPEAGVATEFSDAIQRLQEIYKEQRIDTLIHKSGPLDENEKRELNALLGHK
ncbi:MAG: DNA primase [Gammaproteobacteria bacterium]|nr:DNA primase [Gammaproteobacteria bacterium]